MSKNTKSKVPILGKQKVKAAEEVLMEEPNTVIPDEEVEEPLKCVDIPVTRPGTISLKEALQASQRVVKRIW